MQPRTLYTLLLMLVILGSALGHGEEFKEKPIKRHMRESSNIRALMVKAIRRFGVAGNDNFVDNWKVAEKLTCDLYPDQEKCKQLQQRPYQLPQLCFFLSDYVRMMPAENLKDMYVKFLKFQHAVKELGVII
uniref:Secreted protein n=1 Tax=Panagrellus redivivus TaxID=6233 RepID=A0A7E4V7D0_PANRE